MQQLRLTIPKLCLFPQKTKKTCKDQLIQEIQQLITGILVPKLMIACRFLRYFVRLFFRIAAGTPSDRYIRSCKSGLAQTFFQSTGWNAGVRMDVRCPMERMATSRRTFALHTC